LKSSVDEEVIVSSGSLPVRGAWIEINMKGATPATVVKSLPVRGAWIEI